MNEKEKGKRSCSLAFILHENKLCKSGMSLSVSFVKRRKVIKYTLRKGFKEIWRERSDAVKLKELKSGSLFLYEEKGFDWIFKCSHKGEKTHDARKEITVLSPRLLSRTKQQFCDRVQVDPRLSYFSASETQVLYLYNSEISSSPCKAALGASGETT